MQRLALLCLFLILFSDHVEAFLVSCFSFFPVRQIRDTLFCILAIFGGWQLFKRQKIELSFIALYILLIVVHLVFLYLSQETTPILRPAGALLIPVIIFLAGYLNNSDTKNLNTTTSLFLLLAVANSLFAFWEQNNTWYWTNFLTYGDYLSDFKGVNGGFNPSINLPWNFHRYPEFERRAAGLVAAPLANGTVTAIALVITFGRLINCDKFKLLYLSLGILFLISMIESGTRGAIIPAFMTICTYWTIKKSPLELSSSLLLTVSLCFFALVFILLAGYLPTDGSWRGHLRAVIVNLTDLKYINFFGHGLLAQGSEAGKIGLTKLGGGEGAFFTILFNLGIIGFLSFVLFYWHSLFVMYSSSKRFKFDGDRVCHADKQMFAIFGVFLILNGLTSEHFLTVSGLGVYWYLLGRHMAEIHLRER